MTLQTLYPLGVYIIGVALGIKLSGTIDRYLEYKRGEIMVNLNEVIPTDDVEREQLKSGMKLNIYGVSFAPGVKGKWTVTRIDSVNDAGIEEHFYTTSDPVYQKCKRIKEEYFDTGKTEPVSCEVIEVLSETTGNIYLTLR